MLISDFTPICLLKHLQLVMQLEEKDLHSRWFLLSTMSTDWSPPQRATT